MAVKAVARTRGESRRIRRACVRSPFSAKLVVSGRVGLCIREECALTKDDQTSSHSSCEGAASGSLQCQEHGWNQEDAAEGRKHAHGNIWDLGLDVILSNLLKVEIAVEARKPPKKCDEELGQGRVHVHEELPLDVFRRETTEAGKKNQLLAGV